MFKFFIALKTTFLALLLATSFSAQAADGAIKTVYHMSEGIPQASRAMANIRNTSQPIPRQKLWW